MTRVAVVTGGTRGIGAAVSKALKAAGYQVAATYHSNDEAPPNSRRRPASTSISGTCRSTTIASTGLAQVAKDLGPVDVLVNNAGITKDGMFHKMTPDQWYDVINTNLNSLFNMCRPVIEGMRERGFGRIVNISSVNGQKGQMGQSNYSASKAGDIGFTKAFAQENAKKGVTVNAICPGYIATEMVKAVPKEVLEKSILPHIPVRRLGRARGDRPVRRVPRVRRRRVHHRLDAIGERRSVSGVGSRASLRAWLCRLGWSTPTELARDVAGDGGNAQIAAISDGVTNGLTRRDREVVRAGAELALTIQSVYRRGVGIRIRHRKRISPTRVSTFAATGGR